jgi:hypothetical protein
LPDVRNVAAVNALSSRHHDPDQRRESLVQQIPKRAGALRRRGEQLCQNDWDINAALVLAEDAEALASTCRVLQSTHVAARLENVAECLWDLLDPPVIPDEDARRDMHDLLLALFEDGDAAAVAHADTGSWASLQAQVAEAENGYPLLTRPPCGILEKIRRSGPARCTGTPREHGPGPAGSTDTASCTHRGTTAALDTRAVRRNRKPRPAFGHRRCRSGSAGRRSRRCPQSGLSSG